MKTFLFFLLIILLSYNIQSCKQPKDYVPPAPIINCDSNNTVLIPEDMKARFYFKEGTYWIYKNINSGEIDSMWVNESINIINPVNKEIHAYGWNKCYEAFSFKIFNNHYRINNYYINFDILKYPINEFDPTNETFQIEQISPLNGNRGSYHIGIKGKTYFNDQSAEINTQDSIIINVNTIYKNILNIYYPNGTGNDMFSDMYYVKNIGLVKFERSTDNSIWELIRYKINQ